MLTDCPKLDGLNKRTEGHPIASKINKSFQVLFRHGLARRLTNLRLVPCP